MKKKIILMLLISSILTGCSGTKTTDRNQETSEITEDATKKSETEDEKNSSKDKESEDEKETDSGKEKETKNELTKGDFEVEYKGYRISNQTTEKDIKEKLGVPEDFEINNNGYISTQFPDQIWQLAYPNYTEERDVRVIFYTNLDTDVTTIKKVALEKVPTSRGIMSGDSVEKVYEAYGSANEEKKYDNGDGLLEVNYIKDHQKLSFVVDEESKTVEYIYIYYYIEG